MEKLLNNVVEILKDAKTVALFWHINPDGDCIGSLLGMKKILEKQGKKITCITPTQPSKIFSFLPEIEQIKSDFDYWSYDVLMFLDFSDYIRLEHIYNDNPWYFHNHQIIIFDHHIWEKDQDNWLCIRDHHSMSNCEWILENAKKVRKEYLDSEIATYLYMWLTTDSWNFLFDEDHERIFENALDLVRLWADKKLIISKLIRSKSLETIKFSELLISRLKKNWPILYSYYSNEDMNKYWVDQEQAGYWLTIIQSIKDAWIVITIRKKKNTIKWSIRTKPIIDENWKEKDINALEIAKLFGGWWHKRAAGFSVLNANSLLEQEIEDIIKKIKKAL